MLLRPLDLWRNEFVHLSIFNGVNKLIFLDPVRKLSAPLNKAEKYVFTLTIRVDDEYVKTIGKPEEGITTITLLPNKSVIDIQIKCVEQRVLLNSCPF